ncbi:hypothetical protein ACFU8T_04320 [Sphingobacterium spiritivorum]|uniref:hypothetical protein n=1 Tax=Sphingobacterium spiritivorum TaxID=258 RepID=UPI0036B84B51
MKRIFVFALTICLAGQTYAQKRTRDFLLMSPSEKVETSLYNAIDVIDNRDFKENLGIIQVGLLNSKAQVIPEIPLEKQIQQQLGFLVSGEKSDGALTLVIQKFAVAELTGAFSESGFFDFRASLFVKNKDKSYQRLATIDTAHINNGMDVTKGLLRHASYIVSHFLKDNLGKSPTDTIRYSLSQVLDFENLEKSKVTLYSNGIVNDGVYYDYFHFRDQLPQASVSLLNNDITKGFYSPDSKGKLKRLKANKCYAVVIDGLAYISSEGTFYPLYKNDKDYFFNGLSRTTASASNVIAASVLFGALGAALAANNTEYYVTKIDFYNGSFIKVSKL